MLATSATPNDVAALPESDAPPESRLLASVVLPVEPVILVAPSTLAPNSWTSLAPRRVDPARDLAAVDDDRAAAADDHVAGDRAPLRHVTPSETTTEPATAPVSVRVHAARAPGTTVDLNELAGPMLPAASIA